MDYIDTGMECRIYYDNGKVIKVGYNYLNFYDTPFEFLTNKISLHNYIFGGSGSQLELWGFTETFGVSKQTKGIFFAPVYKQSYIKGHELKTSEVHLFHNEMKKRGFIEKDKNLFVNRDYLMKDLHVDNVIIDRKGNFHFIDTVPFLNTSDQGFSGTREYGNDEIVIPSNEHVTLYGNEK